MSEHMFLLDLTKHVGPTQSLISSARAHMNPFEPTEIHWFVRQLQGQNIEPTQVDHFQIVEEGETFIWPKITALIDKLSGDGHAGASFHVMSYDPYLLSNAGKTSSPTRLIVPLHLAAFSSGMPSATVERAAPSIRVKLGAPGISVPDAIELTKRVLAKEGHTSEDKALRQPYLRGLLVESDERARKNPADIESVNLVRSVVNKGLNEGWLGRKTRGGQSGTEQIWLKALQNTPHSEAPATPASLVPAEIPAEPAKPVADKGQTRTASMVKVLKDHSIYSPKDIRDCLFHGIKQAFESSGGVPKSAGQLLREAAVFAQQEAAADGLTFQYWPAARGGVLQMMLRAGVLLDVDGNPVHSGIQARGTTVGSLKAQFEDECEAFLLSFVINELGDVTERDTTALAHALFKQSPKKASLDQLMDRVDELFNRFGDRISESDDGFLRVT